jgi:osmotically-inducible protein OsmY
MRLLGTKTKAALSSLFLAVTILTGCTTDKDIKAQITGMAKTDVNFAGVEYTVAEKVVTLTGNCPSPKAKAAVETTLKSIKLLKGINNQIQISPVTLDTSFAVKLAVDSVLADYPTVSADVTNSNITLKGKVKKAERVPLLTGIKKLNLPNVENQLVAD